jgi:hypothetical protein
MKMEDMKAVGVQKAVDRAFKHIGLPGYNVQDEGAKNSRAYDGMGEDTREKLKEFYTRWDEKLFELLGWKGWEGDGISIEEGERL